VCPPSGLRIVSKPEAIRENSAAVMLIQTVASQRGRTNGAPLRALRPLDEEPL
jgi:hypothetical protein